MATSLKELTAQSSSFHFPVKYIESCRANDLVFPARILQWQVEQYILPNDRGDAVLQFQIVANVSEIPDQATPDRESPGFEEKPTHRSDSLWDVKEIIITFRRR